MTTLEQLKQAIIQGIRSFESGPADDDFQRGYLAALEEFARIAGIQTQSKG